MKSDHVVCPFHECRKGFEKPLVLTDFSKTPKETYYACPYCLTRVDVVTEGSSLESVNVETSKNRMEKTPQGCEHHFGHLNTLSKEDSVPDECLTCSKLLQCFVKKNSVQRVK